jgi:uncharacterized protein
MVSDQVPPQPPSQPPDVPADARNWAMAAHLSALVTFLGIPSLVGPLIVWLVKRDDHPYIAEHAREALNFQISVLIYVVAGGVLAVIGVIGTLGLGLLVIIPVVIAAAIAWFVLVIIASMRASSGEAYSYPLTIRLVN